MSRTSKKNKIKAVAHEVRAEGGFNSVYIFTPLCMDDQYAFVVDDATVTHDFDESGLHALFQEIELEAYVMVRLPKDPCEHHHEDADRRVDSLVDDLRERLASSFFRIGETIRYSTRIMPQDGTRNADRILYKAAQLKIS